MARFIEGSSANGPSRLVGVLARGAPSRVRAVGIALAAACVVLFVRWALTAFYGEASGFMILLPAVIVASLAAGPLGGVSALVACLVGGWLLVMLGDSGVSPFAHTRRVSTVNFIIVGLFVTWVGDALRRTIRDLDLTSSARRESEARFRLMADTAPSPVWMTDAEARVEFANQALVEFYGQPAEAIQGHVWRGAMHPDDVAAVDAIQAERRPARLPYAFEARFRRADGAWRWMRCSVNPRFDADGAFLGYVGMSFDLTDQREAVAEARESEERFRAIADTAPVLIWVTAKDRSREFVNEAYVRFMGGEYEAVRTANWRDFIHPEDQDRLVAESMAGEATRQPFSLEARYLRHDGEYRWLKSFSRPRLDGDGEVIGFVGVAFDVTDIRETNARLAAIVAQRDAILGQLAEGVIITDPGGGILFVNDAARRIHGVAKLGVEPGAYSESYGLLTEAGDPYPPDDLPLARAVQRGETVTDARWRIRRPDGSEVVAVGNARPVQGQDGDTIGAVLTLRDETARIEAENRLQESETRFRTVADSAPALIWMSDENAQIIFANRRYKEFFGIDAEEMLGDGWRQIVHPDDVDSFYADFMAGFEARERVTLTVRVLHPELGVRWLRCEGAPRFDAGGVFRGFVGANLDVSEAKRAEDDLKRVNELLEERVGDALAEKAKAEADLMHAQRMEAVGRLTGGVAHDFNNLLTVVIGALDIILRSDDPKKREKLGRAALSAARRGESLTHQLLAFSRRQALRPQPVDLNAQISHSEPLLRRAVGPHVDFRLDLAEGDIAANVDPAQLEAALLNLIVNAADAVGDDGRIVVSTAREAVDADAQPGLPPGDYVRLNVADDGAGMPPEVLARVFEPFFTTKAVGKGTGLGLSQVYGFARQSGGDVRVRSTVGKGTTITLWLPALEGAVAASEPEPAHPVVRGGRVLLVEDDLAVSAVAQELLGGLGYEVVSVDGPDAALATLADGRFDIMLSDVVMPGAISGIELGRLVADRHPGLRIVLTSGYAGEDADRALATAPWPFLRKPYSAEELRQVLEAEA